MAEIPSTAALIVAAGRGVRAGGLDGPKQYRMLAGRAVLRRTLDLFLSHPTIGPVLVVTHADDAAQYESVAPQHDRLLPPVTGGATRQESVRRGLAALAAAAPDNVLIHDAVRPFGSHALIDRVTGALKDAVAVLPALPVADTLKAVDARGVVTGTVPRDGLYAAETPQGFRFDAIHAAHERAASSGLVFTDDTAVAEWAGIAVTVVAGETGNIKLTTAADIAASDGRLVAEAALRLGDVRVGTGYDVHTFGPGDRIVFGGVEIPHTHGLVGHSDADVALHALTDAILGALADGDIGVHFPPSDPRWRGASSDRFLADAVARVAARGGALAHLDVAIVAEAPKVNPHRDAMRAGIAAMRGVGVDRVGVKATTNERMGFIGRGEGIAAIATATVRLPFAATP
ncbi:MAG: bifunctional 2-C-methyl-D-erythritol 4-phosphate cytidylyltransferase/2-C-methyl-D-erythritol 2,4-cyclodiphosphate synthase [Bauldia sp.]